MVGTKEGASKNPWILAQKECAREYQRRKAQERGGAHAAVLAERGNAHAAVLAERVASAPRRRRSSNGLFLPELGVV